MRNLLVAMGINVVILWVDGLLSLYVVYQLATSGWHSLQFIAPLIVSMALTAIYYLLDKWILINRTTK
jgi:putative flippase GtrA